MSRQDSTFVQRASATADALTGLIRKVHVAKRQMALSDEDYRAILQRVTGQASSSSCTIAQLEAVVREFTRLGWSARKAAPARAGKRPMADSEIALKLRALWISAYWLGVVDDPREEALSAFVKRVSGGKKRGVDAIQWLNAAEARKAIEGLKSWMEREAKVDWSLGDPRRAVIAAQLAIINAHDELFELTVPSLDDLGTEGLDALIRHLGHKIRVMVKRP